MGKLSQYFDIKKDSNGSEYMEVYLDGIALLRLVLTNKGTAFSEEERVALRIDGLLPPQVNTLEQQLERVYRGYQREPDPISKHQYLRALQERTEILYFALLERHLEEMMPIVYTPTVGQAVKEFSYRYNTPRGLSLSPINIDRASQAVNCYPMNEVRMIVATDSSAILGIGDQGYGGLAIAIGKLSLYTAGGGVSPYHYMPVKLDVGTERLDLINDPRYLGVRQRRLRGEAYLDFLDKFVRAIRDRWPGAVIQWEDLSKDVAFTVLERYRDQGPSSNDDRQGTGAIALAGMLAACRIKGEALTEQRIVVYGAGAGGIGVAGALIEGLRREGLGRDEALARVFVLDSKGLLIEGEGMEAFKCGFAQKKETVAKWKFTDAVPTLMETIDNARATALIGLSGQASSFNEPLVKTMCQHTTRPVVFPLSNPTSYTEALPEDIFNWSDGHAIVATGSPFPNVTYGGRDHPIGQGNNSFIFPGLGFGAILAKCTRITDKMVLASAYALADYTAATHLEKELVYPPVAELQEVSIRVAARVIECALEEGVAENRKLADLDLDAYLRSHFWRPRYLPFVHG
ncbi:MAG: NAD-dependent malic enzyme [Gammaproteobacteria bacterium]